VCVCIIGISGDGGGRHLLDLLLRAARVKCEIIYRPRSCARPKFSQFFVHFDLASSSVRGLLGWVVSSWVVKCGKTRLERERERERERESVSVRERERERECVCKRERERERERERAERERDRVISTVTRLNYLSVTSII
jgi:hypothetical protein